jgi:hypothetical protein
MANGLLDLFGSALGTTPPSYMEGLLGAQQTEDLRKRSIGTGLVNALIGYAAMPKNQNLGLGRILAGAATAGVQGAQGVYDTATQDYLKAQQIAETQRKIDQQKMMQSEIAKIKDPQERLYAQLAPEQWVANKAKAVKPMGKILQPTEIDQLRASGYNIPAGAVVQLDENGKLSLAEGTFSKEGTATTLQKLQEYRANLAKANPNDPRLREIDNAIVKETQFAPPNTLTVNMPSESERTAGFLTSRLQTGLKQLNQVITKNPNAAAPKIGAEAVKFITGSDYLKNLTNPADRQQIENAQLEILDAALTLGTGAAYTREQLQNYSRSYFPQLGDKPATIKDKQNRLTSLLRSANIKAGRAAPEDVGLPPNVTVDRIK